MCRAVFGSGEREPAADTAALGGVDGTCCAAYKIVLLTKTCPAQGSRASVEKHGRLSQNVVCFVLLCPQV